MPESPIDTIHHWLAILGFGSVGSTALAWAWRISHTVKGLKITQKIKIEDFTALLDEVKEIRKDQASMNARIAHLEGLIEGLQKK